MELVNLYTYIPVLGIQKIYHPHKSNVEFVMKRAKLQYAIKPQQWVTKLYRINKNMINYKEKITKTK